MTKWQSDLFIIVFTEKCLFSPSFLCFSVAPVCGLLSMGLLLGPYQYYLYGWDRGTERRTRSGSRIEVILFYFYFTSPYNISSSSSFKLNSLQQQEDETPQHVNSLERLGVIYLGKQAMHILYKLQNYFPTIQRKKRQGGNNNC